MDSFSEFKTFYLNEYMSDVIIIVDGNKLPAHKFLLAAKSKVFHAMFFGDMIESKAKEVEIKDTTVEAFKLMLKYIYFEELYLGNDSDYEMAFEIYRIAHRFELRKLTGTLHMLMIEMVTNDVNTLREYISFPKDDNFEDWISKQRVILEEKSSVRYLKTIENIVAIHEFSNLFELNDLRLACHHFIAGTRNGYNIIAKSSFVCESLETMKTILGTMNVSQTAIIYALRNIRSLKPKLNIGAFQTLIIFDKCTINDIKELRKINLFNDDLLFEVITSKSMKISMSEKQKTEEISKLRSENQRLLNEKLKWKNEKSAFWKNQEDIKKVLKNGPQNYYYDNTIKQAIALIDNFKL
jgi:hypothetical protein